MIDIKNLNKEQKELMIDIQQMKDLKDRTVPIESENFKITVGGTYGELFHVYDKQNDQRAMLIDFCYDKVYATKTTDVKLIEAAEFVVNNNIKIEKTHSTLEDKINEAKAIKENRQHKIDGKKQEKERE